MSVKHRNNKEDKDFFLSYINKHIKAVAKKLEAIDNE